MNNFCLRKTDFMKMYGTLFFFYFFKIFETLWKFVRQVQFFSQTFLPNFKYTGFDQKTSYSTVCLDIPYSLRTVPHFLLPLKKFCGPKNDPYFCSFFFSSKATLTKLTPKKVAGSCHVLAIKHKFFHSKS